MNLRMLSAGLLAVLVGGTAAQAQVSAGAGGQGGNATVNIYGGNIYLTPQGGNGGSGGSVSRGGAPTEMEAASPSGPSLWNHNGSTMRLVADGARRRFFYVQPRAAMAAVGAAPGTLLFEGIRSNGTYSGVAYVFAGQCGSFSYKVSGRLETETEVVMSGMAPKVSRDTCSIDGYRQDSLVFSYLGAR